MDLNNLPFLTVADLSEKIRSREVSPVDVVEAYLDRIEALNPVLNSYITVCADEARADAENAERRIAQGLYRGPMHGIPVAVKDQWWTKGVLTTAGSNSLRDFVPDEDATVQARLKEAGAILLGTTNLTEFAMAYTHHYPYGTPTNPWDQTRMPRRFQRRFRLRHRRLHVRHLPRRRHRRLHSAAPPPTADSPASAPARAESAATAFSAPAGPWTP